MMKSVRTLFVGAHVHPLTRQAIKIAAWCRGISSSQWLAEAAEEKLSSEPIPDHLDPKTKAHLEKMREERNAK